MLRNSWQSGHSVPHLEARHRQRLFALTVAQRTTTRSGTTPCSRTPFAGASACLCATGLRCPCGWRGGAMRALGPGSSAGLPSCATQRRAAKWPVVQQLRTSLCDEGALGCPRANARTERVGLRQAAAAQQASLLRPRQSASQCALSVTATALCGHCARTCVAESSHLRLL